MAFFLGNDIDGLECVVEWAPFQNGCGQHSDDVCGREEREKPHQSRHMEWRPDGRDRTH
jgi:hypothetical protein